MVETHNTCPWIKISMYLLNEIDYLLRGDEILAVGVFMNVTVIHDYYWIWGREGLHIIESVFNELVKTGSVESLFKDVTVQYTLLKW